MIADLTPCPYRRSREGMLVCTVAQNGPKQTDVVSPETCQKCPIPEALAQTNCIHLTGGTVLLKTLGGGVFAQAPLDCEVVGFSSPDDYKHICHSCVHRFPIHLDVSTEDPIRLPGFPPAGRGLVDRDLRQAILRALYAFHARHPERFGRFDVTPEFLAKSLGVGVRDVVRVVLPMEEDGEVKTLANPREPHFRYVALTAKGVHAIDGEPLFEREVGLSVKIGELRNERGNVAIAAGNAQIRQSVQTDASAEALLARLEELFSSPPESAEALEVLKGVREALKKGDKDHARGRLEALMEWAKPLLEAASLLNGLLQLLG